MVDPSGVRVTLLWSAVIAATALGSTLAPRGATAEPLVVITLDGVRWQDVVGPRALNLPNIQRRTTARFGADAPLVVRNTSRVSLPGYRELLTGAPDPSCTTNRCAPLERITFLDHAMDAGLRVMAIASWDGLAGALSGRGDGGFGWSAGRPTAAALEAAQSVHAADTGGLPILLSRLPAAAAGLGRAGGPGPGEGAYRPDAETTELALLALATRPDLLFVGLGDTDEWAHRGDRSRYTAALQAADGFVGQVMDALDAQGGGSVLVTTDHGRSRHFRDHGGYPEAARIWAAARGSQLTAALGCPGDLGDVGAALAAAVRSGATRHWPAAPGLSEDAGALAQMTFVTD